jgi:hypothetical protein
MAERGVNSPGLEERLEDPPIGPTPSRGLFRREMGLLILQIQYRAAVHVLKNLVPCEVPTEVGHEGAADKLCQEGVYIHDPFHSCQEHRQQRRGLLGEEGIIRHHDASRGVSDRQQILREQGARFIPREFEARVQ